MGKFGWLLELLEVAKKLHIAGLLGKPTAWVALGPLEVGAIGHMGLPDG
jgi:hypothetical protein